MKEYILALDVETTGFEAGKDHITEIGAVLWCPVDAKPINILSETIQTSVKLTKEIIDITGITQEMVEPPIAKPIVHVLDSVAELAGRASYYMAHNAEFDRGFLEYAANVFECPWVDLPWIDTMEDIPYPPGIKSRKLEYMCGEHGFLNPFSHRAVFDVLAMCKMTGRYDWEEIKRLTASPVVELRGLQKFQDNHLAKAKGFRWDGERKWWVRRVKKIFFEEEAKSYDFPYKILSEG